MTYAAKTTVAFEKSVSEIVMLIKRAGAKQIGQMDDADFFAIQFVIVDRMIRFRLPLPKLAEMPTHDGRGFSLNPKQRIDKLDQTKRQRGRALRLVINAKLESVESGIETLEQAFLAHVVMADGKTIYDRISSGIALEYQTGRPNAVAGLLAGPSA